MRFYKSNACDDWEDPEPTVQDDELRRLVDLLPYQQRHLISRTVFGGAFLSVAARELGIDKRMARTLKEEALEQLKLWLTEPPDEDPPLDAEPSIEQLVWRCSTVTEWGECQQPATLESGLCVAHAEWAESGATPDPTYHRMVVTGRKEPVQAFLTKSEMDALVSGRYRGDGRRLDVYTTSDPLDMDL